MPIGGYAHRDRVGWHIGRNYRVCGNLRSVANRDTPDHLRAGPEPHVISYSGAAPCRDLLTDQCVSSDDGAFTDNRRHAVVQIETGTDLCSRRDVGMRRETREGVDRSCRHAKAPPNQCVTDAIEDGRLDTIVASECTSYVEEGEVHSVAGHRAPSGVDSVLEIGPQRRCMREPYPREYCYRAHQPHAHEGEQRQCKHDDDVGRAGES